MQTMLTGTHEAITQKVIEAIEDGQTPPWRKAWQPEIENSGHPSNIFSMPFTGIAVLLLNMAAAKMKLASKFWTTQIAWKSFGGEMSGDGTLVPNRRDPSRWVRVYNADEVSGGEAWRFQSHRRPQPVVPDYVQAEAVIKASGATIRHRLGMEAAYYYPPADYIVFPLKEQFVNGPGGLPAYYDSLFHELAHHTEPRIGWHGPSCIREWRAEIAAPFLASQLGLPVFCDMPKIRNHAKHLHRWIKAMKADSSLIFTVTEAASQAVAYLLSLKG